MSWLQMVLNLYYFSVVMSLGIFALGIYINKRKNRDITEIMKKLRELIDDIEDPRLRDMVETFTELCFSDKRVILAVVVLLAMIPGINLVIYINNLCKIITEED